MQQTKLTKPEVEREITQGIQKPKEEINMKDWWAELETQLSLARRIKKILTQNFSSSFTSSTTLRESRVSVHAITR